MAKTKNKAVFLDRDGVINPLVYNIETKEYESPNFPEDFSIYPFVLKSLQTLKKAGFKIFVVSNQPSAAKGKTSIANIKAVEKLLETFSVENNNLVDGFYYCHHHPEAVILKYRKICGCRKPKTLFPKRAVKKYGLNIKRCFFVGDQDSDIECGRAMGFYTVKIKNKHSANKSLKVKADSEAANLYDAVLKITGGLRCKLNNT